MSRIEARAYRAIDTGNPTDAEVTIGDANAAKVLMPGNPVALWSSLQAQLITAEVYQHAGQKEKCQVALATAEGDARALQPFATTANAGVWCSWYFLHSGDENAAREVIQRVNLGAVKGTARFCRKTDTSNAFRAPTRS